MPILIGPYCSTNNPSFADQNSLVTNLKTVKYKNKIKQNKPEIK